MYEFDAIGTHWWLERLDGGELSSVIKDDLAIYTAEFDRRYSRFRGDSLVLELARAGVLKDPPLEMLDMLRVASEFTEATDGSFSLFVGNALQDLGYGINSPKKLKRLNLFSGVRAEGKEVRVEKGVVLDFGGLGKGWLIDQYVEILRKHGVKQFIVNGGGDLYVQSDEPVECALEVPYDSSKMIGTVRLKRGALAASSTVKRAWKNSGGEQHHIIDPATGKPSNSDIVASFITAETALVADVLATVLIIRPELETSLQLRYRAQTKLVQR